MSSVQIKLEVQGDDQVVRSFVQAATAVQQSSDRMRAAAAQSTEAQSTGLAKVSQAMREYRAEEVQQSRSIRFFTQELAGVLPVSDGVAQAIGRVAGSLSMGFGLGLALEGVKWALETFTADLKKAKEEAEAFNKRINDTIADLFNAPSKAKIAQGEAQASWIREQIAAATAARDAARAAYLSNPEAEGTGPLDKAQKKLEELEAKLAEVTRASEIATAALAASSTTYYTVPLAPEKTGTGRKGPSAEQRAAEAIRAIDDEARAWGKLYEMQEREEEAAAKARREGIKAALDAEEKLREVDEEARRLGDEYRREEATAREQSLQQLTSQFQRAFSSVLTGAGSFADKMKGIWMQVADLMIQKLAEWVAKAVLGHATAAAAGAAESQAAIPIIGPILAATAATAMFAMVSGLGAKFSASQGFDVPAGLAPVTQLHPREMVLPEELADRVRGMTGDGGGTIVVQALDARSFDEYLRRNGASVVRALRREARNRRG